MKYIFVLLGILSVGVLLVANQHIFKSLSPVVGDNGCLEKSINTKNIEMNNPSDFSVKEDLVAQVNQPIAKQDDVPLFSTKTKEGSIEKDIISYPNIESSEFEPSNDQERHVVSALI